MASITSDAVTIVGTQVTNPNISVFQVGTARLITLGATSENLALTPTCRYISIHTTGGNHCHFTVGVGVQTATATSHYIKTNERMVLAVPANAQIAAIQGGGASTTLYISELIP